MELHFRAGCLIKLYKCLAISPIITTICFIPLLLNSYYDRLLPLFRQFLLLPNRSNKFMNLQANCSTPFLVLFVEKIEVYNKGKYDRLCHGTANACIYCVFQCCTWVALEDQLHCAIVLEFQLTAICINASAWYSIFVRHNNYNFIMKTLF